MASTALRLWLYSALLSLAHSTATIPDINDLLDTTASNISSTDDDVLLKRQADRGLNVTWGPYVDLGYKANPRAFITSMTTVFTVGYPPADHRGTIFLWPGVWDPRNRQTADLIQTVAEYYPLQKMRATCNPAAGQWCIRPFCVSFARQPPSQYPTVGKSFSPTDKLEIKYSKAPGANGIWTQKVTNLTKGKAVLWSFERCNKPATLLRLATEYQRDNVLGTVDTQHYYNTTITLDKPDPALAATFQVTNAGIQATRPRTSDGGTTWVIEHVSIPPKTKNGALYGKPRAGDADAASAGLVEEKASLR